MKVPGNRTVLIVCGATVIVGAAVFVSGLKLDRPFFALAGAVALPAAALFVVNLFPGYFLHDARRYSRSSETPLGDEARDQLPTGRR